MGPGYLTSSRGTPLLTKAEFISEMDLLFPPGDFGSGGGGSSTGTDTWEYTVTYLIEHEDATVSFDFKGLDRLITSRDSFSGKSMGGSTSLYWDETWKNSDRFIRVDAARLEGNRIKVTYLEFHR
jgi:hypothetical protein